MPDNWRTTPQEEILDTIYESFADDVQFTDINLYGATQDGREPALYLKLNGVCYHVHVKEHHHV